MAHAQWAVAVRSLESGELLFARNADKLMMPASNMKIVTLAAAAEILGWDHRFATTLETTATVENGVLLGDLIVTGGGDPTINTRNARSAAILDEWTAALRAAGIHKVAGGILGDDRAFDEEGLGGGWAWDYLQYGYAAPIGALQYNENVAELTVRPGRLAGDPAIVQLAPGSGLTLRNRTVTGPPGSPETIDYRRHLERPVLDVTGTVPLPADSGTASMPVTAAASLPPSASTSTSVQPTPAVARQVAVVNPTQFFVESLKDGLIARGIDIQGEAVDADDFDRPQAGVESAQRRVLARTESPPLREIASVLMKVSQNQYAETFLKSMGASAGGRSSVREGRAAVLRVLRQWNMDEQSLILADGSGLSRYNYVTASLLTNILERMYSDARHREPFLASLPIAGKDGTVATRLRRTRAEGNAAVKTGSISNVRSLSGYVRTRDGEMLGFSILANDFIIPAAAVNWIADLGVEVLANFSRRP